MLMAMPDFMELTRELCELPTTGIVAGGNEDFFSRVEKELPLRLYRYPSGATVNGWIVPLKWLLHKAEIRQASEVIFDGRQNPLATAYHSKSFRGEVSLEELKAHLFSNPIVPEAHVWHCAWTYRPWQQSWGFCPPQNWVDGLEDGRFEVEIESEFVPGEMLVGECHIEGRRPETIVFNSNNCHPHFANDGFAGTAVMIRLFQWLWKRDNLFSYRLVICPEHMGSIHYLAGLPAEERNRFVGGVFGEMMGIDKPFTLGATFWGGSLSGSGVQACGGAVHKGLETDAVQAKCGQ